MGLALGNLTYILKFVELNRSKYEALKTEQSRFTEQASSTRNELNQILEMLQERLPQVAPVPRISAAPAVATQPLQATIPSAPAAAAMLTEPVPPALATTAFPSAFQAAPPPLASQAMGYTPSASQATGIGFFAAPATFTPLIRNTDGTVSRRMDQVGNNVIVTFSGDDEMASKRAKLFGSSAKYDIFTGHDMSQFPEWVAQFLSGYRLISIPAYRGY